MTLCEHEFEAADRSLSLLGGRAARKMGNNLSVQRMIKSNADVSHKVAALAVTAIRAASHLYILKSSQGLQRAGRLVVSHRAALRRQAQSIGD